MKNLFYTCVFLLSQAFAPSNVRADDPAAKPAPKSGPSLVLPPQVVADVGKPFSIKADTNCKGLRWTFSALTRIDPSLLADKNLFVGIANAAGTYKIDVLGSLNDEWVEASCLVLVGQPVPPPVPPQPVPPPAPPGDPLAADLQKAFTADHDAKKADYAASLSGVYRSGAKVVLRDKGQSAPRIATVRQLFDQLKTASSFELGSDTALKGVRDRLAQEHAKVIGADRQLTDADRDAVASYFNRVADLLSALK